MSASMNVNTRRFVVLFAFVLTLLPAFLAGAQQPGELAVVVKPGANIPFPITLEGVTSTYYKLGWGAKLGGTYLLPPLPFLSTGGGLAFMLAPAPKVNDLNAAFSFLNAHGQIGLSFEPIPDLRLGIAAMPGWYVYFGNGGVGSGPFLSGEASISYAFNKFFSVGASASYDNYWSLALGGPAYHGVGITLESRIVFAGDQESKLRIKDIRMRPVFPVFQSWYDKNPVGEITIVNGEQATIRDVKVGFFLKQFMDQAKPCATIPEMKPGEEKTVPLYALFNDRILDVTEGTKAMAAVQTEYRYRDEKRTAERSETVEVLGRNAMTWDDDRRAASFVTAKDPTVLRYAKGIVSAIRDKGISGVNENFSISLGLFESLSLHGLSYVKDPSNPYEKTSQKEDQADFLQFPVETLSYKAGDCDDLSILFCALLESVNVETAFITVPGHIFAAFALNMEPAAAKAQFSNPDDILVLSDKTWVPVEITMVPDGFLKAWQTGAREWRESQAAGTASFYPVHDAWAIYKPVGLAAAQGAAVTPPSADGVAAVYQTVMQRFVEREVTPRADKLRQDMARVNDDGKLANKLGVLYARYGLYDKAVPELERATARTEYVPALINLGNVYYMKKDARKALGFFQRAIQADGSNATAILGLAKAKYELEDYAGSTELYVKLRDVNPELASKNQYLVQRSTDTARAGTASLQVTAIWAEE